MSAEIAQCFPCSLHRAIYIEQSYLRVNSISVDMLFVKGVIYRVYFFSDCVEGLRGACRSKVCPFQRFPSHPHE